MHTHNPKKHSEIQQSCREERGDGPATTHPSDLPGVPLRPRRSSKHSGFPGPRSRDCLLSHSGSCSLPDWDCRRERQTLGMRKSEHHPLRGVKGDALTCPRFDHGRQSRHSAEHRSLRCGWSRVCISQASSSQNSGRTNNNKIQKDGLSQKCLLKERNLWVGERKRSKP